MARVTVADLAKQLGVNRSTISRALRNDPRISEQTAAKVKMAALQRGYVPNEAARNLALGKSEVISAIIPGVSHPFPYLVLKGVERGILETAYHLRIETAYQPRPPKAHGLRGEDELLEVLKKAAFGGAADGIILITQDFPNPDLERMFEMAKFPVVLVEGKSRWGGRVGLDNVKAGRMATEHLLQRGRRKLALVTGNRSVFRSYHERHQGFLQALEARDGAQGSPVVLEHAGVSVSAMDPVAEKLLSLRGQVDGVVVAAGDEYAIRLLKLLRSAGLRVPEDMSMISVDDLPEAELAGLSTIQQPFEALGRKAVELLVEMIESGGKGGTWLAEPALVVRKTS